MKSKLYQKIKSKNNTKKIKYKYIKQYQSHINDNNNYIMLAKLEFEELMNNKDYNIEIGYINDDNKKSYNSENKYYINL